VERSTNKADCLISHRDLSDTMVQEDSTNKKAKKQKSSRLVTSRRTMHIIFV